MISDLRDILEQSEQSRAELLRVAVDLARRLSTADPELAERAAADIQAQRGGLAESTMLEATVTAEVLGLVVDALMGR